MGNASRLFERKNQELVQSVYNEVQPRLFCFFKHILRIELKDLIPQLNKIYVFTNVIVFVKKAILDKPLGTLKQN